MYDVTTVEQKAALVTAGWKPRDAGTYEAWEKGDFIVALYGDGVRNIGHKRQKDVPLAVAVEVAAILGIAPAGHVLVPVEAAQAAHAALLVDAVIFESDGREAGAVEARKAANALGAALKR